MSEKTALWDRLGRTDPAQTKGFTRAGGFKGTAIKPMWAYRQMTEEFGPCGKGWGIGFPHFSVQDAGDERLVYCTVEVWFENREQSVPGVGGDKIVTRFNSGQRSDDEAYKKAYTDAVTNALKMIGVGADVHMGMFDDSKYVNALKEEFAAKAKGNEEPEDNSGNTVIADTMIAALRLATNLADLEAWQAKQKAEIDRLDDENYHRVAGAYKGHKAHLKTLKVAA